ncbi:osmotically inducible protein C [Pullulanibacillus camelliae]|uniref:Osmotically inducible protein C n=1 Tax=Pullulanibacillus camelliae TaxID=1707096 RepID=A0A8J2YKV1_9BACL|nr:OsmC family protein [Pullulanibacillus camelliae]GGE50116.1 osmotically inducible protein C [Pullulanibacillus camelliae]
MTTYSFTVQGQWAGGRQGKGQLNASGIQSAISVDTSMGGQGIGTNPDELLIASLQSCYLMTLGIHLELNNVPYHSIEIRSEGVVSDEGGLHFESITHYPILVLEAQASDTIYKRAEDVLPKAEEHCMIAKALKGNVHIHIYPTLIRHGGEKQHEE